MYTVPKKNYLLMLFSAKYSVVSIKYGISGFAAQLQRTMNFLLFLDFAVLRSHIM